MILFLLACLIVLFVVLPLIGLALWAFFSTVVVGLVIGLLGRLVVPGPQPIGVLRTVLSGLSGSILGGFLGEHVLGVGGLVTVALEVGVAAAVVLVLSAPGRRPTGRNTTPGGHWR